MINVTRRKLTLLHIIFDILAIRDSFEGQKWVDQLDKAERGLRNIDPFKREFTFRVKGHLCVITPTPTNPDRNPPPLINSPLKPLMSV